MHYRAPAVLLTSFLSRAVPSPCPLRRNGPHPRWPRHRSLNSTCPEASGYLRTPLGIVDNFLHLIGVNADFVADLPVGGLPAQLLQQPASNANHLLDRCWFRHRGSGLVPGPAVDKRGSLRSACSSISPTRSAVMPKRFPPFREAWRARRSSQSATEGSAADVA